MALANMVGSAPAMRRKEVNRIADWYNVAASVMASVSKAARKFLVLAAIASPLFHAAPGPAENIFDNIGRSVTRGAHEAGRAIEHGAHQAGHAIKKGAHSVGRAIHGPSPHDGSRNRDQ
jgi:hypothetical protein